MSLLKFCLVLIYSVVSNRKSFGAIGQEIPKSQRSEDEVEYCEDYLDIASLLEDDDEPKEMESPKKNPEQLSFHWSFWFDNTTKKIAKKDYLSSLNKLKTISSLPAFFMEWKNIYQKWIPCYAPETNFRFFRDDILPMWEDPINVNGGKWVVVFRQKTGFRTTQLWQSLLISLMLGELGYENEICGAVLSIRTWGYMFTIWNVNSRDAFQIQEVSKKLEKILDTTKVKYQSHKDAIYKTSHIYKKNQEEERKAKKNMKKVSTLKENIVPNTVEFPVREDREVKPKDTRKLYTAELSNSGDSQNSVGNSENESLESSAPLEENNSLPSTTEGDFETQVSQERANEANEKAQYPFSKFGQFAATAAFSAAGVIMSAYLLTH